MVEGFEIKVPITLKGGREGEKVGKQIGEKIAAQIKKSFSAIKIGGKQTGGMGVAEMSGMTKGLKGLAGKMGIVGAAVAAIVTLLAKASPYLKGILSIFGRAFMIFFRPFGDFLATLLRPMAILLMKMAVAFMKWLRPFQGSTREAMENAPQFREVDNALANFAIGIANWALQIGAAIGDLIFNIGKGAFDLGVKIGDWFYNEVIVPVADFIRGKLSLLFPGLKKEEGEPIITATEALVGGAKGQVVSTTGGIGQSIPAGNILDIINAPGFAPVDVLKNLPKRKSSDLVYRGESAIASLLPGGQGLIGTIGSLLGSLFKGGGQTGIASVQSDGLYQLHKGEEVVPRTRRTGNKSVILNPTFNFSGSMSAEVDIDALMRRASRVTETELKKRGVI